MLRNRERQHGMAQIPPQVKLLKNLYNAHRPLGIFGREISNAKRAVVWAAGLWIASSCRRQR